MATFLDPRFKSIGFFGGSLKVDRAKEMIREESIEMFGDEITNEEETETETPITEKPKSSSFNIWDSFRIKKSLSKIIPKPNVFKIDKEINDYLELDSIEDDEDSLE